MKKTALLLLLVSTCALGQSRQIVFAGGGGTGGIATDASSLTVGTLPDARLSANIARAINTAMRTLTFSSAITFATNQLQPNAYLAATANTSITQTGTVNGDAGFILIKKTSGKETVTFPSATVKGGSPCTDAGCSDQVLYQNLNGDLTYTYPGGSGGGSGMPVFTETVSLLGGDLKAETIPGWAINGDRETGFWDGDGELNGGNSSNPCSLWPVINVTQPGSYSGVGFYQRTPGNYITGTGKVNQIGLYLKTGNTLTLVANTPNDSTLWKVETFRDYRKIAFTAPATLVKGIYVFAAIHTYISETQGPGIYSGPEHENRKQLGPGLNGNFGGNTLNVFNTARNVTSLPATVANGNVFFDPSKRTPYFTLYGLDPLVSLFLLLVFMGRARRRIRA